MLPRKWLFRKQTRVKFNRRGDNYIDNFRAWTDSLPHRAHSDGFSILEAQYQLKRLEVYGRSEQQLQHDRHHVRGQNRAKRTPSLHASFRWRACNSPPTSQCRRPLATAIRSRIFPCYGLAWGAALLPEPGLGSLLSRAKKKGLGFSTSWGVFYGVLVCFRLRMSQFESLLRTQSP